ncbi:MAG: hypothetical protein ABIR96_05015 [Bdellovibrionota bacterium]
MKIVLAALMLTFSLGAQAAKVLHMEGRAFLQNASASTPLARGIEVPSESHLVLENGSKVLIQVSDRTSFEIQGPARASLSGGLFWNLESGRFLISTHGLSEQRFRVLDEMLRPEDASLEIEIPLSRDYAQMLLLWGSARVHGENLDPTRLYVLEKGTLQYGDIPAAQALKRRQSYAYSEAFFRSIEDEENAISLRNQIVFSQISAINTFSQEASTEDSHNSSSFGLRAELIHKRYFQMPKRPQRIHFLRAPALRIGGGFTYLSTTASVAQGASQIFSGMGLVGTSWRGLAIDTVISYFKPKGAGVSTVSPFQYGVRALYEWDLKEFTANDMMFGLGYGYSVSKVKTFATFRTVSQSLNLSFIFNF